MLLRMTAMAALSSTLLGACGETGSASGAAFVGASRATAGAEARALIDAPAEADVPPPIALHPQPLMVKEGEPAMFGVTYPWRRNGVDVSLMAVIAWLYLAQI